MHQVGQDRLRSQLTEHGRDLAAMVRAVIYEMQQGLPERILIDAELQRVVFDVAIKVGCVNPRTKFNSPASCSSQCRRR